MANNSREKYKLIPRERELNLLTAWSANMGKLNRQARGQKQALRGFKQNEEEFE